MFRRTHLCLAALLLLGCGGPPEPPPPPPVPVWETGLKAFPTPRTGDGPGTMFMIDLGGDRFPVGMLALKEPTTFSTETFPEWTSRESSNSSIFLSFLRSVAGEPSLGSSRGRTLSLSFKAEGTRREQTTLLAIKSALPAVLSQIDFSRGTYFVVIETVSATTISYTLSNSGLDTLGLSAKPGKVGKGGVSLQRIKDEKWQLTATLSPPMRVSYKAFRLTPAKAGLSGTPTTMDDIVLMLDQ